MTRKRIQHLIAAALTAVLAVTTVRAADITPAEAKAIAEDAYIYGYSLVTMEYTRRVMTNVREPEGTRAPMGHLIRMRAYPTAAFKDVTAPNADTLYTTTWLDVAKEPYILSLPDANDRYYLFPMLDGWTDVFQVPGKRTTGTGPQKYAITGPGWKGSLPDGVKEYKSPTSLVWILGRIYCTGTPDDYAAVHKLQDEVSVVPLSAYGKPYTPPPGKVDASIDMMTAVREQVNRLSTAEFFSLLATLMKDNPPAAADGPILAKMAKLGISPGQPFDFAKLDPAVQQTLKDVPKTGVEKIMAHFKSAGEDINGWVFTTKTGQYGTDYIQRSLITIFGLGANRPEDAIYPTSEAAVGGQTYDGAKNYVIHFAKGDLPPVNGFWSLTMYNVEYFFVESSINRYSISARETLKPNADGSVDLYLQNKSPGTDKESNWLPAPAGKFILMFRFYWPKEAIIEGKWKMPPVKPVE